MNDSLFDNFDEMTLWRQHWKNMPEFVQEDLEPWNTIEVHFEDYFDKNGYNIHDRIIYVHFANIDDLRSFSRLMNIPGITHETKYLRLASLHDFVQLVRQNITENTPSIWFPAVPEMRVENKRWMDESEISDIHNL
jgi:hypothetical protein